VGFGDFEVRTGRGSGGAERSKVQLWGVTRRLRGELGRSFGQRLMQVLACAVCIMAWAGGLRLVQWGPYMWHLFAIGGLVRLLIRTCCLLSLSVNLHPDEDDEDDDHNERVTAPAEEVGSLWCLVVRTAALNPGMTSRDRGCACTRRVPGTGQPLTETRPLTGNVCRPPLALLCPPLCPPLVIPQDGNSSRGILSTRGWSNGIVNALCLCLVMRCMSACFLVRFGTR